MHPKYPLRASDGTVTADIAEIIVPDGSISGDTVDLQSELDAKQDTLVSTTNIKTVNGSSILGSGNITINGSLPSDAVIDGANLTLAGQLNINSGNLLVGQSPVAVTENTEAEFDAGTLSNVTGNSDNTLTLTNAGNGTRKAVRFQGSRTNQILVPHNAAYDITGDITLEAWVNLENAVAFSPIITKGASGGPFDFVIQSGGGTGLNNYGWLRFGQSGSYIGTEAIATVRLDRWQHVAVVKESNIVTFYINGVNVRTVAFAPSVVTDTDDVYIGHAPDGFVQQGYIFRGSLFDVRIWNVARSASQIANNMNTLTPTGSGLVGQWGLQEGSGTAIADSSSTNNDGTLSGLDYAWQNITANYQTSGSRTSPEYDISSAETISTSVITWDEVKPVGSTLTIETRYSTNGGSSYSNWASVTNGSPIAGLNATTDLSNGRLQIRQTFASPSTIDSPILSNVEASFTTPAFVQDAGVQTSAPVANLDLGQNTIQGKLLDTGGAYINITAPRYGAVGDGVTPCDTAWQLALADLGLARTYTTSTGKIIFPKGTFYFEEDMEINHTVVIEGTGNDNSAPGTTLLFADGKGVKVASAEVFGGYGTDFGAGKGSILRDIKVQSSGKANAPTSTVNVSGLSVTRTAGALFLKERWGGRTVVKIGDTYAMVQDWLDDVTATLAPLFYQGTVSGNVVTLLWGNNFPVGLTSVTVKIDGVSYNLHASTPSTSTTLTLSSSPAETGSRAIEIQSLGTLTGETMSIFVNHGIECSTTTHMTNVTVSGFAGHGIEFNTTGYNYDNGRNSNTFQLNNILSIDHEGHGLFVIGSNANASMASGINGFNCKGSGIRDECQFGNTYIAPHTDSNRMEPFYAANASPIIGLYSEGNQPASRFVRSSGEGTTGPIVIGGFQGAGVTYDTDAMILSDTGSITGTSNLSATSSITSGGALTFNGSGDNKQWINFGYGVEGIASSASIQEGGGALNLYTNTRSSGGAFGTPTDVTKPSWMLNMSSTGDYVRWLRAPATAGTPSFALLAEIDTAGTFSTTKLAVGGGTGITSVLSGVAALTFGEIAAGAAAEQSITVTGVAAFDPSTVTVTPRTSTPEAGLVWSGYISAANTVTVRLVNITGSPITPAASDWRATVIKF